MRNAGLQSFLLLECLCLCSVSGKCWPIKTTRSVSSSSLFCESLYRIGVISSLDNLVLEFTSEAI